MSGAGHGPAEHADAHPAPGHAGGAPGHPAEPPKKIPEVHPLGHFDFFRYIAPGSQSRAKIIPGRPASGGHAPGVAVIHGKHPQYHLRDPRFSEPVNRAQIIGAVWAERVYNRKDLRELVEAEVGQMRNNGWHQSIDPFLHAAYTINSRKSSLPDESLWHDILDLIPNDLFPTDAHGHSSHGTSPTPPGGGGGGPSGGSGGRRRRSRQPVIQFNPVINVNPNIGGANFENVGNPHFENIGNPSGFGNLSNVGNAQAASGRGRIQSPNISVQDARRRRRSGPGTTPDAVEQPPVQPPVIPVAPTPDAPLRDAFMDWQMGLAMDGNQRLYQAYQRGRRRRRPALPSGQRLALNPPSGPFRINGAIALPAATHEMTADQAHEHGAPAPVVASETPLIQTNRKLMDVLNHPDFLQDDALRHAVGSELDYYSRTVHPLAPASFHFSDHFADPQRYQDALARISRSHESDSQLNHFHSALIRGIWRHQIHQGGRPWAEPLVRHFDWLIQRNHLQPVADSMYAYHPNRSDQSQNALLIHAHGALDLLRPTASSNRTVSPRLDVHHQLIDWFWSALPRRSAQS